MNTLTTGKERINTMSRHAGLQNFFRKLDGKEPLVISNPHNYGKRSGTDRNCISLLGEGIQGVDVDAINDILNDNWDEMDIDRAFQWDQAPEWVESEMCTLHEDADDEPALSGDLICYLETVREYYE